MKRLWYFMLFTVIQLPAMDKYQSEDTYNKRNGFTFSQNANDNIEMLDITKRQVKDIILSGCCYRKKQKNIIYFVEYNNRAQNLLTVMINPQTDEILKIKHISKLKK